MLDCLKKTKWLSLFTRTYRDKSNKLRYWDFCSRKENPDEPTNRPDAVVVVPFLEDGSMVVIKQFRPSLNDYIIENIAGLHDQDDILLTAKKELKEEVGLEMTHVLECMDIVYTSVGISDESCSYVFCKAKGEVTTKYNEDSEDIEPIIINREQAKKLLNEEKFSARCWLILKSYIHGYDWMN